MNKFTSVKNSYTVHPCFDRSVMHHVGRVHLPVAPRCNIKCNYCIRRYSCFNETRPGVTATLLKPIEATDLLKGTIQNDPRIKVVGIAGPGDALANHETFETIKLINGQYANNPSIPPLEKGDTGGFVNNRPQICISTNGLLLPKYLESLSRLRVDALTVTVNAVDPLVASRIYAYINFENKKIAGIDAAKTLIKNQVEGISGAAKLGIRVKVNTVLIPGVNDNQIVEIAQRVSGLGANRFNIIPIIPQARFSNIKEPGKEQLENLQAACGEHIDVINHCQRCRSDAVGLITDKTMNKLFAVASSDGLLVDQHFGHANKLYIYSASNSEIKFKKAVDIEPYCSNNCDSDRKMKSLIEKINSCSYLLCLRIGHSPVSKLKNAGIRPVETYGKIEEVVMAIMARDGLNEIYRMI